MKNDLRSIIDDNMEEIIRKEYCDLCEKQGVFYGKRKNFRILICKRCGLMWANPFKYFVAGKSTNFDYWGEEIYLSHADSQKKRFHKQLKTFIKKANVWDPRSLKILEVGPGLGFFLDTCEGLGIKAEGCDISERSVKYANRERERVRLGTLDGYYQYESFHAVFAFNLIEHLPYPKKFFSEAHRVLKSGGTLVLETPVQESLFHRLARIAYFFSKGRLNYLSVESVGHIYQFSKKTFKLICHDIGFNFLYQKNMNSPFGEIWSKSSLVCFDYRPLYRLSLPILWALGKLTSQGNRLFILLQKP